MKKNCWIFVGTLLSTSLLAQPVTNSPAAAPLETPPPASAMTNVTPPPATTNAMPAEPAMAAPTTPESASSMTNAPATKSAKKKSKKKSEKKAVVKKKEYELKTVPLVAGPAVAAANHVNIRGQPKLKSEILTRLTNEQPVTVIEEIVRNNSGPDEPSAWAKIALPSGAHTWINTTFIDSATKTIKPKKLNVRSGPGENFSVLGQLQKGDTVQEITTKGDWTEIEPPATAYGFVAAQYLKQGGAAPTEITSTTPTMTSPTTTNTVPEGPTVATTTTETSAAPGTTTPANTTPETTAPTNTTAETTAAPAPPEPPPKRIVQHEGLVRGTISIQAPTPFALVGEDGRMIDYLYTASPDLDLRRYKGLRIVVTGEEAVEERWPGTPIITIQKIQVLSDVSGESH